MKLEVRGGCFAYPKSDRQILKEISFCAASGQTVAILGPNGAGKTTLLRCIMGLLRWQSGMTYLDGAALRELPPAQLWRTISYVPQMRAASAAYTVEETVLLGRSARIGPFALPGQADVQAAEAAMDRLGLLPLRRQKCSALSGGQMQLVLLARALVNDPQVLILDEPESNLDFRNQLLMLETIADLAQQGVLCLFNTHYPAHALRWADHALLLEQTGCYQYGPAAEVITQEKIEAAFGVQTLLGEWETPEAVFRDIFPVRLAEPAKPAADAATRAIAVLALVFPDRECAGAINAVLHRYRHAVTGRMGMPRRDLGLHLISVSLDATRGEIQALTDQLGRIPGVSVKAAYAKEWET